MTKPSAPPNKLRRFLKDLAVFVLVITAVLVIRSSFANHYNVPSGSMEPTLQVGDRVFVDMTAYGVRVPFTNHILIQRAMPKPGDIVIFKSPQTGVRLIKRVVAVGGQSVELTNGRLMINNVPVDQGNDVERLGATRVSLDLADGGGPDIAPMIIPHGKVLVLGDHRGRSLDGRFFGLVDQTAFYGKAQAIYWRSGQGLMWKGFEPE